jgi:hypothetical protein
MRQTCALNEEKKVFMNKKLLVSAFLFFFIFSSWMLASEKTYIKEFLGFHYSPGYDYEITPDHTLPSGFESVPFLTFYVPPSPKESNAIFFDIFAQVIFKWSGLLDRIAHSKIVLNIISDVIPSDIWVYATNAVLSVWEKIWKEITIQISEGAGKEIGGLWKEIILIGFMWNLSLGTKCQMREKQKL